MTPHLGASTMEAQVCLIISLMHAALFCINFIFITLCLVLSNHASLGLVSGRSCY